MLETAVKIIAKIKCVIWVNQPYLEIDSNTTVLGAFRFFFLNISSKKISIFIVKKEFRPYMPTIFHVVTHPRIPRGDSARYINPWDN